MFDESIFLFAVNIFITVLCGGIFMLMPQLTRKSYLFGVKIPPEQSSCPEARAMKRRYILICVLGAFFTLIVCIIQFILRRDLALLATLYLPFLIISIGLAAFISCWKSALRLKENRGWQAPGLLFDETSAFQTRGKLSALPWIWYVLSFFIVVAAFAVAIMRYPALPDMIAGHMDASFQPTRMVEKTWWNVLMMPVFTAATLALMILVAITIEKAKLQIDPSKPRLSFAQHRVYRRRMGHALGFLTVITILFMAVMWLPFVFPGSSVWGVSTFWGSLILLFIPIMTLLLVQIKTGQGGCKVKINVYEDSKDDQGSSYEKLNIPVCNRAKGFGDDKYWILGMFYCNGEDPAYIVEDRFGVNIGFNYARLPVRIGLVTFFLGLIALYVWITKLIWIW